MENARTSVQVVVLMLGWILSALERRSLWHDLPLSCVYPRLARVLSLTLLGAMNVSGDVSQCDSIVVSWVGLVRSLSIFVGCWQCCRVPSVTLVALLEVTRDPISALRCILHELFLLGAKGEQSIVGFYLACPFWQSMSAREPWCYNTCLLVFVFFLSQSRVIAMDKEEAAVDLTRENAHRYKPVYYPFFVNCCLRKTKSPQYLDMWFVFITTGNQRMFSWLSS